MLSIRMTRVGSKKKPFFRVVVTEARSALQSSFVENLGTYNPRSKPAKVEINKERVQHWLQQGRAAVRLGAHAAGQAPDARSVGAAVEAPADRRRRSNGGRRRGAANPLRAVVEVVARALVDQPDAVRVTETERRGMTVLELTTAPGDMGKIIGRQGRTAAALRTLVAVTAEKHGKRAQLDIRD